MSIYLSIDGDDIGNKIAHSYLDNDEDSLSSTIQELDQILSQICEYLKVLEFKIIFCAADGIVCKGLLLDQYSFVKFIKIIGKPNFTFSVGIGNDLRSSFFALKYAKSIGKNKIVIFEQENDFSIIDTDNSTS